MRRDDELIAGLVRGWLARAEEDLAVCDHLLSARASLAGPIAFHAQQAAEKLIKAFLVFHQIEFPKTHDLGQLLDLVAIADNALSQSLHAVTALTRHAVEARYPVDLPSPTIEDAAIAVQLARKVRDVILEALKSGI